MGSQQVGSPRLRPIGRADEQHSAGNTGGNARRGVVVIDDHALLADTLAEVLGQMGRPARTVRTDSMEAVREDVQALRPSVALVDYHLGSLGTADPLIASLTADGIRVIVFTGDTDRFTAARCIRAGALAVLGKGTSAQVMLDAIDRAEGDRPVMDESQRFALVTELRNAEARRRRDLAPFEDLTPRERDVLAMMCEGLSAGEMAEASFISLATVRSQIRAVLVKLGVGSQLAAVAAAYRAGWVDRPGPDSSTLAMTQTR